MIKRKFTIVNTYFYSSIIYYKNINTYDGPEQSKNDLPAYIHYEINSNETRYVWLYKEYRYRDNDLPAYIRKTSYTEYREYYKTIFDDYLSYRYRYHGYTFLEGSHLTLYSYKFIKGICFEQLRQSLM